MVVEGLRDVSLQCKGCRHLPADASVQQRGGTRDGGRSRECNSDNQLWKNENTLIRFSNAWSKLVEQGIAS